MNHPEPIASSEHPDRRIVASIDEHIADAVAARARARNPHGHTHRRDPGRRLIFQLADAYVRELRASRTA